MWSIRSIFNKIFGKKEKEIIKQKETKEIKPEIKPEAKKEIKIKTKPMATTGPVIKEKIEAEPKAPAKPKPVKKPKEPTELKKNILKQQPKLPIKSTLDLKTLKKETPEIVKTKEQKIVRPKSKDSAPNWKDQADAAERIKRAFQGFFYDVASLENLNNQPDLKKNNFESFKTVFKTKLEQNLSKLDLIDQQILQHISNNLLEKDIKDITEKLETQVLEQVSKIPDKYIS